MAEDHKAAVRGPGRGKGLARNVGDLAQVAARGLDQPDVGAHFAGLFHKSEGGAEKGAVAGQGFQQVGAEAVGHFGQIALVDFGIFLAEQAAAGIGFKSADLDGFGAAVAVGPEGGDHNVRTGQLETLEVQSGRFVARQHHAAQHGLGVREAHERQEAEILLHQGLQFRAHARGLSLGALERGGQSQIDDILAGIHDIHAHGRLGPGAGQRPQRHGESQGQEKEGFFHGSVFLIRSARVSGAPV